jgi:murein DD-endopeptidase MepM/ murein hydrolase activator NlpD
MKSKRNLNAVLRQIFSKGKIRNQIIISLIITLTVFVLNMLNFSFTRVAIDKIKYTISSNIDFVNIYKGFTTSAIIVQPNPLSNLITQLVSQITGAKISNLPDNAGKFTISDGQLSDGITQIKNGDVNYNNQLNGRLDALPVSGTITEGYGERINPITDITEMHAAIDISAEEGSPIKSFNSGTVENVGWSDISGNYFSVKGDDGIETTYAHCLDIYVVDGDKVTKDDIVATVGNTGQSTGSHLHFEIIKDGEKVDPIEFINNSNNG